MASRLKEDEKNERIIRSLLKLPSNRKCINCNSMGPQYVCITFWTFVCTTCSGIHREFTHRVKSVSMAKFTSQEVSSLQSGGNECAKEIYFNELDPLFLVPDSRNVDRLRDFIKHAYVDRKYSGERSTDKPPRVKMGEKEEASDYKRTNSYGSGTSRSPSYEDSCERRSSDRPTLVEGRRSPGYEQNNLRISDYGRSPVRAASPIVNDWRREDRFGNGRNSEGDSKLGSKSPDSQKDVHLSSPPMNRPVREILGENDSPLPVIEPPKVTTTRVPEISAHTQRNASSSSLTSSNGNPSEIKRENSLIDFDTDPKALAPAANLPIQLSDNLSSTANSDNWACFDNAPAAKASQPPQNLNTMDSLLTQLSVTAPAAGLPSSALPSNSATPPVLGDSLFASAEQASITPSSVNAPLVPPSNASHFAPTRNTVLPSNNAGTSIDMFSRIPSGSSPPGIPGLASTLPANGVAGQWSNVHPHQRPIYPASNSQGVSSHPVSQVSQAGIVPGLASSGITAQLVEVKTSGRKELPADIFAAMYAPQPLYAPSWQTGFPTGMGFPMQYNTAVPVQTFSQPPKSMNPFDTSSESYGLAPTFPSMMPLQNALPYTENPSGLMRTSSLGAVTPQWIPSQTSAYPSATPQLASSFTNTVVTPGSYMNHQLPNNMAVRPQGFGGFGNDLSSFSHTNPSLEFAENLSAPSAPSSSRNPFG